MLGKLFKWLEPKEETFVVLMDPIKFQPKEAQMSTEKSAEWLNEVFTDRVPNPHQSKRIDRLYDAAKRLAEAIEKDVPSCADKSVATRKLREAMHSVRDAITLRALV